MFQNSHSSSVKSIFCCNSPAHILTPSDLRLHQDTNRELHEAIFHSFLAFAARRQRAVDLLSILLNCTQPSSKKALMKKDPPTLPPAPEPIFTPELLRNNPLKAQTPYVIHLTARLDFGPVYSHQYFVVPANLAEDWIEISLLEWFVAGEPFKLKAERWDMKCTEDNTFFRMTLRPNLAMRGCYPVKVPQEMTEWIVT